MNVATNRLFGICDNFAFNKYANIQNFKHYNEFHFFWETTNLFSQWYPCVFEVLGKTFNSSEQYMMYEKAILFNDYQSADKILCTSSAKKQKELGRGVKNFNESTWTDFCRKIVYEGNKFKFLQNPNLLQKLLGTEDSFLVESSPFDAIWGVCLSKESNEIHNIHNWRGKNWLGCVLTLLRDDIIESNKTANYDTLSEIQSQHFYEISGIKHTKYGVKSYFLTNEPYCNKDWNHGPFNFSFVIEPDTGNFICEMSHRLTNNAVSGWDRNGNELPKEITSKYFEEIGF